jgi:hypothetical protein
MATPIEAIRQAVDALAVANAGTVYVGSMPAGAAAPFTVLHPYGGRSEHDTPTDTHAVQVTVYDTDQAQAYTTADALYAAIRVWHNQALGTGTGWTCMIALPKEPPFSLPAINGQGGPIYRVAFNCSFRLRPTS